MTSIIVLWGNVGKSKGFSTSQESQTSLSITFKALHKLLRICNSQEAYYGATTRV